MKLLYVLCSVAGGVVATVFADVLLKQGAFEDWRYMLAGFVIYGTVAIPVACVLRFASFGTVFLIWEACTLLLGVAIATAFYHEPLTVTRALAVLLAICAMALGYAGER